MRATETRHHNERGGVMLYLLVPVVLCAAAAGLLFMFKDAAAVQPLKESLRPTLSKVGLMAPPLDKVAGVGEGAGIVESATASQLLTVSDLYGNPQSRVVDTLDQIRRSKSDLSDRERRLEFERRRVSEEQALLKEREKQLQAWIDQASAELQRQRELDQERQSYQSSQRVKRIRDLSATMMKLSPKNAASILSQMWKTPTDAEGQTIVIESLRSIGGSKSSKIMDALIKTEAETASEIMVRLVTDDKNDPGQGTGP